jgi:KaiC/GvpD/RAD55 family RecA-like ATPase
MSDLMINKTNVTKLLQEKYKKLQSGWVTLIEVPTENHMAVNIETLKTLIDQLGYTCVYITLSKPYTELEASFKSKGVDTSKVYFIDAISKMYGETQPSSKRCVYTSGPIDVDSITSAMREILSSLGSVKKCVFLDSVTTVLLYNSLPRTLRFSQFLTQILKKIQSEGVIVCIAKGEKTKNLIVELKKHCDEYISV